MNGKITTLADFIAEEIAYLEQHLEFWPQPRDDRVLVERIEGPPIGFGITVTDAPKSIKGRVLAVGPGKWHPGEWWKIGRWAKHPVTDHIVKIGDWEWIPGWRETMEVKPGMLVLFNSKWNDLAHAENSGTGADGKGPLERPLSYRLDKNIHLVREADIFGILTEDVPAKLGKATLEQEFFVNKRIAGPWSEA